MRILYVLDRPDLGGGIKVAFQHAELLRRAGHDVRVVGRGPKPGWASFVGPYTDTTATTPLAVSADLVIATFYTTVEHAEALQAGPIVHFCQGYEGDFHHLQTQRPEIEKAYRRRYPMLVITPHLKELVRSRFGREAAVVPPPIDPLFRPALRWRPGKRPRILISGIFEAEVKGIRTALEAVKLLRERLPGSRLTRISVLPQSDGERALLDADSFLCSIPPAEVARIVRAQDLVLFTSRPAEGFGLPLLEAMASKVPAVAGKTPGTEFMTDGKVALVEPTDHRGLADAAFKLLSTPKDWRAAREAAYTAARRFMPGAVAAELGAAVDWAQKRVSNAH